MRLLRTLVLTLAAGCASSGSSATPSSTPAPAAALAAEATPQTRTTTEGPVISEGFVASYDRIWRALPEAYAMLGIKVNVADTSTRAVGFAGTVRRKLGSAAASKYFGCGSSNGENTADSYDLTVVVATQVGRSSEGRILVTTHTRATASAPMYAHDVVTCTSKGTLEQALFDALKVRLR